MKNKTQLKNKTKLKKAWEQRYLYLMIAPAFLLLFLFAYMPMGGIVIAFKNYNPFFGIWDSPWVGFEIFEDMFTNAFFIRAVSNTLIISLLHILWGFPAPIIFALLLNEFKSVKFKRVVQTITYLPHFISWVTIGGFLINMLSPTEGIIGPIMDLFGIETKIPPLANPDIFRGILVGSGIWKGVGWGSIIYLASMTSIDTELYEVASLDGANRIRRMWHITLPGITPVIITLFILQLGGLLSSNFEQIFVLSSDSVNSVADVISTYTFREALGKGQFSYGTAVGLFQSVIGFVLVVSTNFFARKMGRAMW